MYQIWNEKSVWNREVFFGMPWCPKNKLSWYKVLHESAQLSGTAKSTDSFPGSVTNLSNNDSRSICLSARILLFSLLLLSLVAYFVLNTGASL